MYHLRGTLECSSDILENERVGIAIGSSQCRGGIDRSINMSAFEPLTSQDEHCNGRLDETLQKDTWIESLKG